MTTPATQTLVRTLLAAVAFASVLLVPVSDVRAAPAADTPPASQHTMVFDPSQTHTAQADFGNAEYRYCPPATPLAVGYTHTTAVGVDFPSSDEYENCVFESAVRFDLSTLHQQHDAVITMARLSYDDQITELQREDGSPTDDPHDIQHYAVWDSCTAQVGVPADDWRGATGLVPNALDDTASRLDRTTWDMTDRVRQWFTYPDDQNDGLVLLGYDEGADFSNNAECVSLLSNVKLTVDFVALDPTPTPLAIDIGKLEPIRPTTTPSTINGLGPALPDLAITRVDTASPLPSGLVQVCGAGRDTAFSVHVRNVGRVASTDFAVVSFSIDGVPRATTTVDALPAGVEKIATIDAIVLSAGTHTYRVTVNEGQRFAESDFSNNSLADNHLACL